MHRLVNAETTDVLEAGESCSFEAHVAEPRHRHAMCEADPRYVSEVADEKHGPVVEAAVGAVLDDSADHGRLRVLGMEIDEDAAVAWIDRAVVLRDGDDGTSGPRMGSCARSRPSTHNTNGRRSAATATAPRTTRAAPRSRRSWPMRLPRSDGPRRFALTTDSEHGTRKPVKDRCGPATVTGTNVRS